MKITKLISWHLVLGLSNDTFVKSVFVPVGTKLVGGTMEDNLFFFVAFKKFNVLIRRLITRYITLPIIFMMFRKAIRSSL